MRQVVLKRKKWGGIPLLQIGILVAVLFVVLQAAGAVYAGTQAKELAQVTQTIQTAAAQCYAVEGAYPETLEYLLQNYGLFIDTKKYMVDYRCYGSNLPPEITVLPRETGSVRYGVIV